jgi:hypothetical protein
VATLNVIRRTGMARNTVKKYLRSDETEPTYAKRGSSKQARSLCREAGYLAGNGGNKISETAAQFETDLHKPMLQHC